MRVGFFNCSLGVGGGGEKQANLFAITSCLLCRLVCNLILFFILLNYTNICPITAVRKSGDWKWGGGGWWGRIFWLRVLSVAESDSRVSFSFFSLTRQYNANYSLIKRAHAGSFSLFCSRTRLACQTGKLLFFSLLTFSSFAAKIAHRWAFSFSLSLSVFCPLTQSLCHNLSLSSFLCAHSWNSIMQTFCCLSLCSLSS